MAETISQRYTTLTSRYRELQLVAYPDSLPVLDPGTIAHEQPVPRRTKLDRAANEARHRPEEWVFVEYSRMTHPSALRRWRIEIRRGSRKALGWQPELWNAATILGYIGDDRIEQNVLHLDGTSERMFVRAPGGERFSPADREDPTPPGCLRVAAKFIAYLGESK